MVLLLSSTKSLPYLEQGMNKAVIARDLGVSRRTV